MATSSKKSGESNDFSVEEKIVALYELQKIDSKIDEINKIKGELPLEVQDLEDEIAGLETRMANITSEVEGLTASTKQRKEEIEQAKVLIAKYEQQQDNVRNNREFDSLSKEIEYQKLEIELCEKKIKEYAADIKIKKKMIEDTQAVVADRKHHIVEASRSGIVNDLLDAVHGKILSAAVEHDDGKLIIRLYSVIRLRLSRLHSLGRLLCGRFLCGCGQNDERCEHRRDQQQREKRFGQFSHQYFLLLMG